VSSDGVWLIKDCVKHEGDFSLRLYATLKGCVRNDTFTVCKVGRAAREARRPSPYTIINAVVISTTFSTPVEKGGEISFPVYGINKDLKMLSASTPGEAGGQIYCNYY